jgi:preprotein translocase subunit YajC
MNLIAKFKQRRREKQELQNFRDNLQIGDKVFINDHANAFYGQVLYIWPDRVKIISTDMHTAAYPHSCIYPID